MTASGSQALDAGNARAGAALPPRGLRLWLALLRKDLQAVYARDRAARSLLEVPTCYPGLHATWLHRIAHGLWRRGHLTVARILSHTNRFATGIEIRPGARIGRRLFVDHGAGVVIGETAELGDDVVMYTGAIVGGTTSEHTKRHPTIGHGVVVGSHAVIAVLPDTGERYLSTNLFD